MSIMKKRRVKILRMPLGCHIQRTTVKIMLLKAQASDIIAAWFFFYLSSLCE